MTTHRFTGLANTHQGRTGQMNRGFRGMADEMKRKQIATPECDEPQTTEEWRALVASLQHQLDDAQALINDMRAQANSDLPAISTKADKLWNTAKVAEESGVAVCTICRNVDALGGIKICADWFFPVGTKYGRRRKAK